MTRYKCTVSYVGRNYDGWQSQTQGRSIQEHIESVLQKIAKQRINVTASGRTDAGVSAKEQVFMFDSDMNMTGRKWMGALNGYLPDDIHIMNCEETDLLFHARYNVRYKKYTYRINDGPYDVFTKDTAYQCQIPLDYEKMVECSKVFLGTHDFTSFNSSPLTLYPDQTRTVFKIDMNRDGHMFTMTFYGKGFLRYMVRMMSAAIIDVGKHKLEVKDVKDMLEAKSRTIARRNAPAQGLTLEHVDYFEMIALNHETQVREFLRGDRLPYKEWILPDLEKRVSEKQNIRSYAFCIRNGQRMLGFLSLYGEEGELVLYNNEDRKKAEAMFEHIHIYMEKNGYNGHCSIVPFNEAERHF